MTNGSVEIDLLFMTEHQTLSNIFLYHMLFCATR